MWRSQPCKITRKQYNSGDSELKKETPVQTEVGATDLICLSQETAMGRNSSQDR
jgi:hypothetical protein